MGPLAYVHNYMMGLFKDGRYPGLVYDTGLQMMVNQKMERGSEIRVVGAGVLARAQMANFFSWPWKCDPPDTHDLVREQRGGHGQDCSSGRSGGGGWKMSSFSFQTGSGYTI